jgi:hypothetical protein
MLYPEDLMKKISILSTIAVVAIMIASASVNGTPVGPEIDGRIINPKSGFYYHYHTYNRATPAHAFYGSPAG